jgi:hypothetical protein
MSPTPIITRKVTKQHLRTIWNNPTIQGEIMRQTTQRIDVYVAPAPPESNQEDGAISYVYDLMDNVNRKLLGTFHCYKNLDGSYGASGLPDPIQLLVNDTLLCDP